MYTYMHYISLHMIYLCTIIYSNSFPPAGANSELFLEEIIQELTSETDLGHS